MGKKTLFIILGSGVVGAAAWLMMRRTGLEHRRMIPSDASMVFTFNLESLAEKSDLRDKFKDTRLYQLLTKEVKNPRLRGTGDIFSEIFKDPAASGFDMESEMYYFSHGKGDAIATGFVIGMKDHYAFGKLLSKLPKVYKKIKNKKDYFLYSDGVTCFAWNTKGFVRLAMPAEYFDNEKDGTVKRLEQLMTQDEKKSIIHNAEFMAGSRERPDIGLFIDYGKLLDMYGIFGGGNLLVSNRGSSDDLFAGLLVNDILEDYKKIRINTGVKFEDDKVRFSARLLGEEKDLQKIDFYNKGGVSEQVLQCMTDDRVYALLSWNVDAGKMLSAWTSNPLVRQGLLRGLESMGLTAKEFGTVFDGQMIFALVDFKEKVMNSIEPGFNWETGEYEMIERKTTRMTPIFTANIGIKNRPAFDKMMGYMNVPFIDGIWSIPVEKFSSTVYMVESKFGVTLTNDSMLAAGMATNRKLKGAPDKELAGLIKSKPSVWFLDLKLHHYTSSTLSPLRSMLGQSDYGFFTDFMSIFSDIKASSDGRQGTMELALVKGDGNSLYRLLKHIDSSFPAY